MTGRPNDPRVGTDLGPYRIESVIGRGGMGVVYLATHSGLDRRVALKLLTPDYADDEAFRARFLRESKLAASIDHPNIIPIYDAGQIEGTYYLAMRYVEGTDLQQRVGRGALAVRNAVAILTQVASALDAAHAAGLVHRDVKPANVLIAAGQGSDGADHAYLTDFGLTKQRGSQSGLTNMSGFLGTLDYIAPEQIEGRAVDGQADQYALASVAVTTLSGTPPFPRDADVAVINAHLHDAPPSVHLRRPELPIDVDAVIARGMAKEPAARYPTCGAFVADLRSTLGVTAGAERPVRPQTGLRDRRLPLVIGSLSVVGLVALAAFVAASSGSPSASDPGGLASGSPSSSVAASLNEAAYPNDAEQALLAALPDDLAETCVRGPYNLVESEAGSAAPTASLRCPQEVTSGANEVILRQFRPLGDLRGGNPGFNTDAVISFFQGDFRGTITIPPGDCATSPRAGGRWERSGATVGGIVCYRDTATGDAILYWSYQDGQVLARALNQRGDSAALYGFFRAYAPFIDP